MRKGVQKIYSEIAETYEVVNHVLTFGMDILWRKKAAKKAASVNGKYWLDVCSGTGEMAQNLALLGKKNGRIVVSLDFSYPMLIRAKNKKKKKESSPLSFSLADAGVLPFPDNTFDLVTISFATRNICQSQKILEAHLNEFHRVLRPNGYFLNLETSQPRSAVIRKLYHLYVKTSVKHLGAWLSGSKPGYRYLSYTIPRFYSAPEFSALLSKAGFSRVETSLLLFGVAAIHMAQK